ncbi:uncharacterized protein LOC109829198 isoform X2 [Asparagus officinalis]|uniref:uncharacterized protein LOC109829198 isoform X2 n=1 Tax=Asparagus officinalis TaxID=4686 RepID=UPI00098E0691|nr:uncharacterized protein LOC109829198 isoform X2 [Asparagus officinalis]
MCMRSFPTLCNSLKKEQHKVKGTGDRRFISNSLSGSLAMARVEKSSAENTAAEINQREGSSNQNSAIEVNPREENSSQNPLLFLKKKGTNNPIVHVKGARIYDSENGKTCHQCRQKTRDFAAFCKQLKKGKLCTLTYCHKCLLNRYGENADEVGKVENWVCPKCRGVCNCSFCMKRKGFQPTGILTHVAKSNGFNSVHELLDNKGAKKLEPQSIESKASFYNKGSSSSKRSLDKESQSLENEAGSNEEGLAKRLKLGTSGISKEHGNQNHGNAGSNPLEDIILPQGSPLTEVAGTELPAQDVGAALQFLEFCNAFSEVLDIREGQPECVLRDLTRGCLERHGVYSAHVEFTIKLLSLIRVDMKKDGDAWLQALKRCIEESKCTLEGLPLDLLDNGSDGYDNLKPSIKLKILNFLCDEVLYTGELRSWIDKAAVNFDEGRKENKKKLLAAKKKEKVLKQQVKDETAEAMLLAREGTPHSLPEFDGFLSQLRADADEVHAEVLAYVELISKKNQRSDAVRTDCVVRGDNQQIFWKLSGYNNRSNIILQVANWDSVTQEDKWFFYNEEEDKVVEKYISSLRNSATVRHRSDDVEEGMKSDSHDSRGSRDCLPQKDLLMEENDRACNNIFGMIGNSPQDPRGEM